MKNTNFTNDATLSVHELDDVYREMLSSLSLTNEHRNDLKKRGFSDHDVEEVGCKSLHYDWEDLTHKLQAKFGLKKCSKVPGLYARDGEIKIAARTCLLVPYRDYYCRIKGLKCRYHTATDRSYFYFSSKNFGGPSSGCHVHHSTFNQGLQKEVLRVTEGELKADYAALRTKIPTISIPGVAMWNKAYAEIKLYRPKKILVAFDTDCQTNRTVGNNLYNFARSLNDLGWDWEIETWK